MAKYLFEVIEGHFFEKIEYYFTWCQHRSYRHFKAGQGHPLP